MDQTHSSSLTSWVASANGGASDFPIQNLPFGVYRKKESAVAPRIGVAIGEMVLDITTCLETVMFSGKALEAAEACAGPTLNQLMGLGREFSSALRLRLSEMLRDGFPDRKKLERALVPMKSVELLLPASVGDYTDFYASIHHATNVGSMFRPDNPLLPNYKHIPIGYHGRASSLVVSGTPVRRPHGQTKRDDDTEPVFGPTQLLDYELEVGVFIGKGNTLGESIKLRDAWDHIFGICLLNDWSARDVQKWEYQPLGPFLAKNFASTLSPWIVTTEALEPFRAPSSTRSPHDPVLLPYLVATEDQKRGAIDLYLEVYITTERMRVERLPAVLLSRGNFNDMYWTVGQMLAHHASNGCNLRTGDLLGSGTVSGTTDDSRGCLLELTWRGSEPFQLPTGESRRFLLDGDDISFRAYCTKPGFVRIGFGECSGRILPAKS